MRAGLMIDSRRELIGNLAGRGRNGRDLPPVAKLLRSVHYYVWRCGQKQAPDALTTFDDKGIRIGLAV